MATAAIDVPERRRDRAAWLDGPGRGSAGGRLACPAVGASRRRASGAASTEDRTATASSARCRRDARPRPGRRRPASSRSPTSVSSSGPARGSTGTAPARGLPRNPPSDRAGSPGVTSRSPSRRGERSRAASDSVATERSQDLHRPRRRRRTGLLERDGHLARRRRSAPPRCRASPFSATRSSASSRPLGGSISQRRARSPRSAPGRRRRRGGGWPGPSHRSVAGGEEVCAAVHVASRSSAPAPCTRASPSPARSRWSACARPPWPRRSRAPARSPSTPTSTFCGETSRWTIPSGSPASPRASWAACRPVSTPARMLDQHRRRDRLLPLARPPHQAHERLAVDVVHHQELLAVRRGPRRRCPPRWGAGCASPAAPRRRTSPRRPDRWPRADEAA